MHLCIVNGKSIYLISTFIELVGCLLGIGLAFSFQFIQHAVPGEQLPLGHSWTSYKLQAKGRYEKETLYNKPTPTRLQNARKAGTNAVNRDNQISATHSEEPTQSMMPRRSNLTEPVKLKLTIRLSSPLATYEQQQQQQQQAQAEADSDRPRWKSFSAGPWQSFEFPTAVRITSAQDCQRDQ